jgi:hypothetical protein
MRPRDQTKHRVNVKQNDIAQIVEVLCLRTAQRRPFCLMDPRVIDVPAEALSDEQKAEFHVEKMGDYVLMMLQKAEAGEEPLLNLIQECHQAEAALTGSIEIRVLKSMQVIKAV